VPEVKMSLNLNPYLLSSIKIFRHEGEGKRLYIFDKVTSMCQKLTDIRFFQKIFHPIQISSKHNIMFFFYFVSPAAARAAAYVKRSVLVKPKFRSLKMIFSLG
jgi:hypothetical protein